MINQDGIFYIREKCYKGTLGLYELVFMKTLEKSI